MIHSEHSLQTRGSVKHCLQYRLIKPLKTYFGAGHLLSTYQDMYRSFTSLQRFPILNHRKKLREFHVSVHTNYCINLRRTAILRLTVLAFRAIFNERGMVPQHTPQTMVETMFQYELTLPHSRQNKYLQQCSFEALDSSVLM